VLGNVILAVVSSTSGSFPRKRMRLKSFRFRDWLALLIDRSQRLRFWSNENVTGKGTEKEVTLTGFVAPSEWDEMENIIEVSISTENDAYVVELDKRGQELLDLLYEDISVTGLLLENKPRKKRIRVIHYQIVETDDGYHGDINFDADRDD
jgi:hypothetical protein